MNGRMERMMLLLGVAVVTILVPANAGDECLTCHSALGDKPSQLYLTDIHYRKGISCAGCHGGNAATSDMDSAMDRNAGFLGVPRGDSISLVCSGCHSDAEKMKTWNAKLPTDQLESLEASVHGKLGIQGSGRIAQCTTCHSVHNIVAVSDPTSPVYPTHVVATCTRCHNNAVYIREYNPSLRVDQLEKYRTSVHGMRNAKGDAKVAECASCHGSHDILSTKDVRSRVYPTNIPETCGRCHSNSEYMKEYHLPTDQLEQYRRSVHGIALLQKHDPGAPACNSCHGNHGAAPPGLESVSNVCGTCHALNADLFSASPHKRAFDERHLPECETCHGNHGVTAATDTLLGVGPGSTCRRCHSAQENAAGYRVAASMRQLMDSLESAGAEAAAMVQKAEQRGMEVSEAEFKLRDVRQARLEARTMVHSFDEKKFETVIDKGLSVATVVRDEGQRAAEEYVFRRVGLGVATLIITVLALALWLYIRRLERAQSRTATEIHSSTN
jgi:hypothetical protein